MPMKITSISISERPSYERTSANGQYKAKVAVSGENEYNAGITIDIGTEQLEPIVRIMEQIVAANMAAAAEAFRQDVIASLSGSVIEQPTIAAA